MQFISKLYEFLIQSYDYAKMTFKTSQSRRDPGLKSPVQGHCLKREPLVYRK